MRRLWPLLLVGLPLAAWGSSLTLPYTWTFSMPTVAELNAQFAAVKAAVDDNDARLDAILSTDACTSSPCDLAADTTVGGAPIGGGGGAPTTVNYLVGTADAGLSAEIAVGVSPGGELGGTWASPTIDSGVIDFSELTGTASDGQIPDTITINTAGALAVDGANCSPGNYPLGVDAAGAVQGCTAAGGGGGAGYAEIAAAALAGF